MRGPQWGLILSLLTLTVCNDITESFSLKPSRRQNVISSFVTSDQTKTVSFLYKNVSTLCEDVMYCKLHVYDIIQISIFVISISLSFFCLCLANRFDITLMICFRTIIIALNSYLTTLIDGPIIMLNSCWNQNSIYRYRGFWEAEGSGPVRRHLTKDFSWLYKWLQNDGNTKIHFANTFCK